MFGKYGKTSLLLNSRRQNGSTPMSGGFGFQTPKKNQMLERTAQLLEQNSSRKATPTPKTPRNGVTPTTPGSSKKMTPLRRLKLTGDAPATPQVLRKRVKNEIEKRRDVKINDYDSASSSSDSDSEFNSDSESDSSDDTSEEDEKENLKLTPNRKRKLPETPVSDKKKTKSTSTTATPTRSRATPQRSTRSTRKVSKGLTMFLTTSSRA